ncbi:MAG: 30S ribosomal protein S9 [Candidatus Falkowbacteria bacterium GW2011_GWC2_38_22]|uniref:Small ribosomal subunit protein uS9 n=1 Tax=Candidatus Falkowbacteria bacterium GW2011_GWE1_38_31 TaxID=1618638 RepID=A0A0G0M7R5_9BACT|nr:MAG: 30S ribosomal protein S9 [Candidatus Falkowbacteria bacterium GW2011_GWF2_38_1205]KKQ60781.1 MAG: 30S ribosomal protein S9 [Candidatus Falkowbacteria bacterium GW2011_GWC2_38_22]KKQ62948.1 MAG: 30S ribosomal protein S9 [Candidatus Falkowbacteria bacterium GW2011_GWF1_38_22]KKQ64960.1 MAG: 30S ribosomal protein S9 [Candidatus Falkowbacteria bacterium GW2011_GWE2_38_254]KKQ69724.1 MAG: 30S ribosomal protein S9 [Candidatus Falkowbacteria bacterium GW2011_GWE1_38_31]KKQ72332.1 MAG: 30S rib
MQEKKPKEETTEETASFKGKYISTIGRRKSSVARIRMFKKGIGEIIVNDMKIGKYFDADVAAVIKQPLKLTSHLKDVNISVIVTGGGKKGQADAIRHGIARALVELDENLKPVIKPKDWLTRDARVKERKKPGLKKARRAPQWSKR